MLAVIVFMRLQLQYQRGEKLWVCMRTHDFDQINAAPERIRQSSRLGSTTVTYCGIINYTVPLFLVFFRKQQCAACKEANKCFCSGEN